MSILKPGDVIDDTYQVERLLGSGGMAHVYVVRHQRMPRKFALKVLQIETAVRGDFLKRFEREAEILATLRHAHIVDVIDCNKLPDGNPYLVMELLEGEDLSTFIARSGALSLPVALHIVSQIGEALEAAHRVGITHRDLKPSNIFLCKHGQKLNFVKVLDYGIAKLAVNDRAPMTAPAQIMGTPGYMAPEQARGETHRIGPATDQFALAATLYEMLTGHGAFYRPGDTLYATIERVVFSKPEPLPQPQIDAAVQQALSKEPEARFPTLASFLAAVGATSHTVYGMSAITLPPSSLNSVAAESARIHTILPRPSLKFVTGVCGLAVVAIFSYFGWSSQRAPTESAAISAKAQPQMSVAHRSTDLPGAAKTTSPASAGPLENQPEGGTAQALSDLSIPSPSELPDGGSGSWDASADALSAPEDSQPAGVADFQAKRSRQTRFGVSVSGRTPTYVIASISQCARVHLRPLSLANGTIITLERAGTLTVVSAPKAVSASGINECLRQQLLGYPSYAIPLKATLTVRR